MAQKLKNNYNIAPDLIFKKDFKKFNYERSLFIYLMIRNPRYNIQRIGELLNVTGNAISKNYKRFIEKLNTDESLILKVEKIRSEIYD